MVTPSQIRERKILKARKGMATVDVVFIVGTLFPMCMVLYYIAERSLANLYQMISVMIGSPVM
jgi:hypothetical protein